MLSFDITDRQIKLVRGGLSGAKILLHDAIVRNVPEGLIVNGYITEVGPVAGLIKDMLAEKKFLDKDIVACINSSSILYKELEVIKPKSLKNAATIEAMITAQMGVSSDYNISYSIIGEGASDGSGNATLKVLATACPQRMVDGYQLLFGQAGLKLKQINISNNCITRLIMNSPKLKENMPFLCIQVDPDFVNINLYENGQVALSRYVKIDPSDFDNNSEYVNVAVFDNLFRMLQFIQQRPGSGQLKHILFYGVIPDFVTLAEAIGSFNIPSSVINTPPNVERKKQDIDFSLFANAAGAFYKVDPIRDHVNLLQSTAVTSKQTINAFPIKLLLAAGAGAGAVFLALTIIGSINLAYTVETNKYVNLIQEGEFDRKEAEMNLMTQTYSNFVEYKESVQTAKTMFDFMPRPDLPQVWEMLLLSALLVELDEEMSGVLVDIGPYSAVNDEIRFKLYTADNEYPSNYVEMLEFTEFFDDITYKGFRLESVVEEEIGIVDEMLFVSELTMKIKSGQIFYQAPEALLKILQEAGITIPGLDNSERYEYYPDGVVPDANPDAGNSEDAGEAA